MHWLTLKTRKNSNPQKNKPGRSWEHAEALKEDFNHHGGNKKKQGE